MPLRAPSRPPMRPNSSAAGKPTNCVTSSAVSSELLSRPIAMP
jgi:hypothetical protein